MTSFGYIPRKTIVDEMSGASKIFLTLAMSISAMITFDTRFLLLVIAVSISLFIMAKISFKEIKAILVFIFVFLLINNIAIFLFAPEQGVLIYGTRNELLRISERYTITVQQLYYQMNVTLKYFSIVPIALVFFLTTDPAEFAWSLNTLGVSYKIAYAVSLALRYIPEVQRNYRDISQAQQARGVDISKKAPIKARLKGVLTILFPLVFSSLDRIEQISNAMEMRGFGREKKRTWYSGRSFISYDYIVAVIAILCIGLSVYTIVLNNGRFYNPFI
ncbi:MAG: energy-coupling factor transporter transmembrane protein EcfT [Oscillospiraceae bacterium]|nr:energy-coupling factor transporter transmembrane protein EcfT [Oscillospiraceae bacterium]